MKDVDLQEVTDSMEATPAEVDLTSAFDRVEVELEVRVGTITLSFGELKSLTKGATISLEQDIDEPVDLMLKGSVVARGKLVVVDDRFGVEIVEIPR